MVKLKTPLNVLKRDGTTTVPFEPSKVYQAVYRCMTDGLDAGTMVSGDVADRITEQVCNVLQPTPLSTPVSVEAIQAIVEQQLMAAGQYEAARQYIIYRDARTKARTALRTVPEDIKAHFQEDLQYFSELGPQIQFYDKYARFNWEKGRRETWREAVDRVILYLQGVVARHCQEVSIDSPINSETWE